jgi:transcriptional regulator with XRE-family HTH domain
MNDMKRIGAIIRTVRSLKRMSQGELAKQIPVNQSTISNFETGQSDIKLSHLLKILEVLELDPTKVLKGDWNPEDFWKAEKPARNHLQLNVV